MNEVKLFQDRKIRSAWNEEEEQWYFSIEDIVTALTDSADPKQYIKRMRSRDTQLQINWGTICTPVEMIAKDGKVRKVRTANTKGILRIIQSIPSPKAEPFKLWMAKVAAERLDQMQDPELSINQALMDYRRFKGLKKENLRDNMTNKELVLNMLAELSTKEISENRNPETFSEHMLIAQQGGEVARNARMELEEKTGKAVISPMNAKDGLMLNKKEDK